MFIHRFKRSAKLMFRGQDVHLVIRLAYSADKKDSITDVRNLVTVYVKTSKAAIFVPSPAPA